MTVLSPSQFDEVKDLIRDTVTYAQQSKEKETSTLHKEILHRLDTMSAKIDSHDCTIQIVTEILPELKEAIKAYRATSTVGKILVFIIIGIPALAACVGGIIYFEELFKK
tara:strand:+ start:10686 stop:11015 length:330 start_codon:yes stop_codon:yes gene_type:complete